MGQSGSLQWTCGEVGIVWVTVALLLCLLLLQKRTVRLGKVGGQCVNNLVFHVLGLNMRICRSTFITDAMLEEHGVLASTDEDVHLISCVKGGIILVM